MKKTTFAYITIFKDETELPTIELFSSFEEVLKSFKEDLILYEDLDIKDRIASASCEIALQHFSDFGNFFFENYSCQIKAVYCQTLEI